MKRKSPTYPRPFSKGKPVKFLVYFSKIFPGICKYKKYMYVCAPSFLNCFNTWWENTLCTCCSLLIKDLLPIQCLIEIVLETVPHEHSQEFQSFSGPPNILLYGFPKT